VIQLWNVADPTHPIRVADPLRAHNETSWSVEFSPDGTLLASAGYDGTARLWNLLDPAHPVALGQPLADANDGLSSVTFHPDGHHLATSGTSGTVALWTLPTGVIPNHSGRIDSPAFSVDGAVMVTASDNIVQLWTNNNHLTRAATLRLPDSTQRGFGYTARVDPSGRILATASSSAPTVLWDITDIANPVEFGTLPNTSRLAYTVAFSPDGHTVATAADDHTVQLWDITDPKHPTPATTAITGHTAAFASPAISPDSKTLAIGGKDQIIRLWDITDPLHATPIGSPLHSRGNADQVTFSPDGKTLASGSDNGSVQLWDVTDRNHPALIGDSLIPPGAATRTRVAFDPQGRLYAASRDGTIRIFNLDTDNTTHICASTRNVLTEQRWNQILPLLPFDPPCQQAAK
jgi:WD40 repeat protein